MILKRKDFVTAIRLINYRHANTNAQHGQIRTCVICLYNTISMTIISICNILQHWQHTAQVHTMYNTFHTCNIRLTMYNTFHNATCNIIYYIISHLNLNVQNMFMITINMFMFIYKMRPRQTFRKEDIKDYLPNMFHIYKKFIHALFYMSQIFQVK